MEDAGGSARLNEITLSVCVLCVCCVCMCVHNWLMRQHSQGAIQQTNSLSQTVLNNMKRPLQELVHSSLEAASKQSVNGALGEATQLLHRLKGETVKWSLVVHTWSSQPLNCRIMFWCFSRASCRIFSAGSIFQRHSVPTGLVWCLEGGHTNTHRRQLRNNCLACFNGTSYSRWVAEDQKHYWHAGANHSECRYRENWVGPPAVFNIFTPQLWQRVSRPHVKIKCNYTRVR